MYVGLGCNKTKIPDLMIMQHEFNMIQKIKETNDIT